MTTPVVALDPILSTRSVCAALGDIGRSTLWRMVKAESFPPPVRIGNTNRCGWRQSVVQAHIDTMTPST